MVAPSDRSPDAEPADTCTARPGAGGTTHPCAWAVSGPPIGRWITPGGTASALVRDALTFESDGRGTLTSSDAAGGEETRRIRWRRLSPGHLRICTSARDASDAPQNAGAWGDVRYEAGWATVDAGAVPVLRNVSGDVFWSLVGPLTLDPEPADRPAPPERWRTRLIRPPARPYSPVRGLVVMARNPARWWSEGMYREGVRSVRLLGRTFVHVARPELARTVLLDDDDAFGRSFVTQRILVPAMGAGLLTSDGETWRRQRRLLAPVFRTTALERFVPAMDRHALACRDALLGLDGRTAPVLVHTSRAALGIVVETLFGGARLDREAVARDADDYLNRLGRPDPLALLGLPDALPRPGRRRGLAAVARLRARCHGVLAALRAGDAALETHGLVGRLLAASDPDTGERLDDEAIVDNVHTFMAAGHETTAVALAWTLYALAHQPGLAERLAEESRTVLGDGPAAPDAVVALELHRRTVQETMRLYPPAAAIVRTVLRPVRVGPFELDAGDHVTVATMPMQRNPAFWPDPHAFDESRFAPDAVAARDRFAYLPFGDGPRVCIGAGFALTEAVLVLARLTPALRFAPADGKPPEPVLSVTLRPSDGMRLRVARRR